MNQNEAVYTVAEITDGVIWDKFVQGIPKSTFIDSWLWGEFQRGAGFQYKCLGVYKNGDLSAALPISIVRARRGSYLHLRHAPLMDWGDVQLLQFIIKYLRGLALEERVWFVRISPLIQNTEKNRKLLLDHGLIPSSAHEVDAERTLSIDLKKDEAKLLSEMRKHTRYYIRKAEKLGVSVELSTDMSKFDQFWEIFIDAVERNKWIPYKKEYVAKEFELFSKVGMATMYLAKYQDRYISAGIFTHYNGTSFYHHSGSLTEFRNIPSTYPLIWCAMKDAKQKGFDGINLWGVVGQDEVDHPWYGLSLFKRGFGGEESQMVHAHDLLTSPWAHATRMYEKIESRRGGY